MRLDPREKASKAGYWKAKKLAEKENRKRASDEARAFRKEEQAWLKAEESWHKLRKAEGALVELPALVTRDGTVKSIGLADAIGILGFYLTALCLDCETSGYWIGHQFYELRTLQLGGEDAAVVFDALDASQREAVKWILEQASGLHAHSASADLCPLVDAGLISWDDAWAKMTDSVLIAKLTDPHMSGSDADGLKELEHDLLREYAVARPAEQAKNDLFKAMGCLLKTDVTTPPDRNGWHQVNRFSEVMIRYAGSDVLALGAVLRALPPLPVHESVLTRERVTQGICARAALTGFPLDLPHIQLKIADTKAAKAEAQDIVRVLTDGRITNPSSSKDVLAVLTDMGYQLKPDRKTRQPSAGKGSLEPLAARGDHLARYIVEYRACVTRLGLLLRPLENLCTHGDAVMRPTVYTINAVTGRMSCVRPNGQQFSRQGGVRACVTCWPGYLGISADFAGCEICVAAALSGDRQLYEAETGARCHKCERDTVPGDECSCGYKDNGELAGHTGLHWLTAHTAYGKGATKEDRYNAKRGTFTRLFGGGPQTAADQVGTELKVMQELFTAFNSVAPVFTAWDQWMKDCFDAGMMVGRDFATGQHWHQGIPGSHRMVYQAYSGRNVYITRGAHAAGNGAIQGTARELLVDGLLRWQLTRWGHLPVLPVHDQIIVMVPEGEAEEATASLAACMTSDVLSSPGFPVHIGVDTDKPFTSWPDSS